MQRENSKSRDKKDLLHFGRIFDWKTSFQQFDQSRNLRWYKEAFTWKRKISGRNWRIRTGTITWKWRARTPGCLFSWFYSNTWTSGSWNWPELSLRSLPTGFWKQQAKRVEKSMDWKRKLAYKNRCSFSGSVWFFYFTGVHVWYWHSRIW